MDAAIQLTRRYLRPLAVIAALFMIPSLAIGIVARAVVPSTPAASLEVAEIASSTGLLMLLAAINVAVASVGMGALVLAAARAYEEGTTPHPMEAVRGALRRAPAIITGNLMGLVVVVMAIGVLVVASSILVTVLMFMVSTFALNLGGVALQLMAIAMTTFIVLGTLALMLLTGAHFANITAAAVLEELGPWRAFLRSVALVRGNLRRTAGVVAIGMVLYLVAYLTVLAAAALIFRDLELATTASSVVALVTYPFIGSLMTVLYYDLRVRGEGYDVELMALALAETDKVGEGEGTTGGDEIPSTPA